MSNPLVDRILNNPLTFVSAKHPDQEVQTVKTSSYIVLTGSRKQAENQLQPAPKKAATEEKRPMSMAQAIAAYTGQQYLMKAQKKKAKMAEKPAAGERHTPAAGPVEESSDDAQYESASEFHTDSSFQGFRSSSEDLGRNVSSDAESSSSKVQSGADSGADDSEADAQDSDDLQDSSDSEDLGEPAQDPQAEAPNSPEDESEDLGVTDDESAVAKPGADSEATDEDGDFEGDASESEGESESESEGESEGDSPGGSQPKSGDESESPEPPAQAKQGTPTINERMQLKQDLMEESRKTAEEEESEAESESLPTSPSEMDGYCRLDEESSAKGDGRITSRWPKAYKNKRPLGLLNYGVTCYMNSAIQAMLHIPAVQNYLVEVVKGKHKHLKPRSVTHTFAELAVKAWGLDESKPASRKYINPKKLVQRLEDINCMMSEWRQEDSHEYFMSLMSRLQEDSTPKGHKLNESVLYDIFGGLLHQEVICQECKARSVTKQEFYDLSLGFNRKRSHSNDDDSSPVEQSSRYSVEKSLRDFFSTETIRIDKSDKSSGYYCEKCKKNTVATKRSLVESSPETLLVHMKRFKFNGNSSSKVKQAIHYPKYLDLGAFSKSKEPVKYQLMSVIVHEGRSISSGHYIAHCLQPNGNWSTYDDEYINQVSEKRAMSDPSAYCLVYMKLAPKGTKRTLANERASKRAKLA